MRKAWICFLPMLVLSACFRQPPVIYPRLIIDTYPATTGPGSVNTFITLFDSSGDPTVDINPTLWNNNTSPYTVDASLATAEDNDGNIAFSGYAQVDYSGGLPAGTYYIRVRGAVSTGNGPYAIRVLLEPDESYASWWFTSYNYPDDYEDDDTPKSGGVPENPVRIEVGGKINRYITANDVDWFVITLP